jgi:putative intracellular protease/amidase
MAHICRDHRGRNSQTYILIGDGFDELEVVYCLHRFRQAGLPIKSVSLFDELVFGRQGVGLKADYVLADKPFDDARDYLLILPAGGRNGDSLRRDARVKSLLQTVNSKTVRVAVTDGDCHLANDVDQLLTRPTYQPEADQDFNEFVDLLARGVA